MSKHVFAAADNSHKLTLRSYKAWGFTLGVFVDAIDSAPGSSYGEQGSLMVALSRDEATALVASLTAALEGTK